MTDKILNIVSMECGRTVSEEEELIHSKKMRSVQLYAVICALEDEFQITLSDEDTGNLDNFSTVRDIRRLVEARLAGQP